MPVGFVHTLEEFRRQNLSRKPSPEMSTSIDMSSADPWIAHGIARPDYLRQPSLRRQLSNRLSSAYRKHLGSSCNTTACAISVCFVLALLACIISCFNFVMYAQSHGFGPISPAQLDGSAHTGLQNGRTASGQHSFLPMTVLPPLPSEHAQDEVTGRPPHHDNQDGGGGCKAYAHIVGNDAGPRGNDEDLDRLLFWRPNATQNVRFRENSGVLQIQQDGFYYVYSQIYFGDSEGVAVSEDPMSYSTVKNREELMVSVIPFKEFSTKYHGGIFHLKEGDEIGVRVSDHPGIRFRINMNAGRTFFGVFMLTPTPPAAGGMPGNWPNS